MEASDFARAVEQKAATQIGVLESPIGSNAGPQVNQYLATVHLPPGNSWCSAFACWCVAGVSADLGVSHELKFSGSALHLWSSNPDLQFTELTPESIPCIGIFDEGGGLGHVVIVVGLNQDAAKFSVIAGNTNNNGSRQGIGTFSLEDHYSLTDPRIKGFLRIA